MNGLLIAALISIYSPFAVSAGNVFDTKAYCRRLADVAGGSYQIEEACREQEREAQASLARKEIPSRVENYCRKLGETAGGSYNIMNACVDQELAAKGRLR